MSHEAQFGEFDRLLIRLTHAIKSSEKITFLLGSALNTPGGEGDPGVPGATALIEDVVNAFNDPEEKEVIYNLLKRHDGNQRYQQVMKFMLECRGQEALNTLVQKAVLKARKPNAINEGDPRRLERDIEGWYLRPAAEAIGSIVAAYPSAFSAPILTSNFDPLIEISLRKFGRSATTICLPSDGQFNNIIQDSSECQVVHFHGYWQGSDTLHTPLQLTRNRPHLKGSLRSLLRETTLVILGYGGWSDVFTQTLVEVIKEQSDPLDVLWTFYSGDEEDIRRHHSHLLDQMAPLAGQRVLFYKGVDCHILLPRLRLKLQQSESTTPPVTSKHASQPIRSLLEASEPIPVPASWVGRELELAQLLTTQAQIVAITGFGGVGKSSLAARYLKHRIGASEIISWAWADCKEQTNTLRTQLMDIIENLSQRSASLQDLRDATDQEITDILLGYLVNTKSLLVFDNIDSYVDLEEERALGILGMLIRKGLAIEMQSQLIFTARPGISDISPQFLHLQLQGLTLLETRRLFEIRGIKLDPVNYHTPISEAHSLTSGNAMELDWIVSQISQGKVSMDTLLSKIRSSADSGMESPVLKEVWSTLNENQRIVLRYLAESARPVLEQRAASYVGQILTFNKFSKTVRVLKSLSLVISKKPENAPSTLEVHPLVRSFIERNFKKEERYVIVSSIIKFCDGVIIRLKNTLNHAPLDVLQNWIEKIELCLVSDRYEEALRTLMDINESLVDKGYVEEYLRIASMVIEAFTPDEGSELVIGWDQTITNLVTQLSYMGRFDDADYYINKLKMNIRGKSARYIGLCHVKSYSIWLRKDVEPHAAQLAASVAQEGVDLKNSTGVDTPHDCKHALALALRDSGEVEKALSLFLTGYSIATILDGTFQDASGSNYGNIGRCLQFQGKHDEALICLKHSASRLIGETSLLSIRNRGWAFQWIGESLEKKADYRLAFCAYRSAAMAWKNLFPVPEAFVNEAAIRCCEFLSPDITSSTLWECEQIITEWIQNGKSQN